MILRLTVFGVEVFCFSAGNFILEDQAEDEEESGTGITGGASHNFERDTAPLSPDDRWDWGEWDFGFGRPKKRKGGNQDAAD